MEMFDRMTERDPHLGGTLQTRRHALTQAEWTLVPGDEDNSKAIDARDMVHQALLGLPDFDDSVEGLLDAIPKGIAVQEIVYAGCYRVMDLYSTPVKNEREDFIDIDPDYGYEVGRDTDYEFETGRVPVGKQPAYVTYLVGQARAA